jgi:hypothetical protein
MECLFLKVKKVNLVVSALVLLALSGCSSTSRVYQLNKEIIALESRSEDRVMVANDVLDVDGKFVPVNSYPLWVLSSDGFFNYPVGVSCKEFPYESYADEIRIKEVAADSAMVDLFQKGVGSQRILAKEELKDSSEDSEYQMIIKKQSYGLIGRNEVAKEGYFKLNGINSYCVAIRAL